MTWGAPAVTPPPQTFGVPPPPQVWGAVQLPQFSVPPQPSETMPQLSPSAAHVVGTHVVVQTLFVQVWPMLHVPQLNVPPHPSGMLPQFFPCAAHVVGVHETPPAGTRVAMTMFQSVALPNVIEADWPEVEEAISSSSAVAPSADERSVRPGPALIEDATAPTLTAA